MSVQDYASTEMVWSRIRRCNLLELNKWACEFVASHTFA